MKSILMDKREKSMFTFESKKEYEKFIEYLFSLQDIKYKNFHQGLFKEDITLIGVRTPQLKRIAKEIAKQDFHQFLKYNTHTYYEESVLHGLVIGYLKYDIKDIYSYILDFLPFNTNWAINDITCANLKIFKKNQKNGLFLIYKLLKNKNPWYIRFALVLLLDHYLEEVYLDVIFEICDAIIDTSYYVLMGEAWLLSTCFIKYPEKTKLYLKDSKINPWAYNKTISKICDSYRVSRKEKEQIRNYICKV